MDGIEFHDFVETNGEHDAVLYHQTDEQGYLSNFTASSKLSRVRFVLMSRSKFEFLITPYNPRGKDLCLLHHYGHGKRTSTTIEQYNDPNSVVWKLALRRFFYMLTNFLGTMF